MYTLIATNYRTCLRAWGTEQARARVAPGPRRRDNQRLLASAAVGPKSRLQPALQNTAAVRQGTSAARGGARARTASRQHAAGRVKGENKIAPWRTHAVTIRVQSLRAARHDSGQQVASSRIQIRQRVARERPNEKNRSDFQSAHSQASSSGQAGAVR